MWTAPLPIFEDEDEAELISRFVEFSARYPAYTPFEICQHIFKDLRDPSLRANQAALQWSKDLLILERIRQAKLNGGAEPGNDADEKQKVKDELLAMARDEKTNARDRAKFYELWLDACGLLPKRIEKKSEDRTRRFPQVVIAQYAEQ